MLNTKMCGFEQLNLFNQSSLPQNRLVGWQPVTMATQIMS